MAVQLGPLMLKNPLMPASGTFGPELISYVDPNLLGAVITPSITLNPQDGAAPPRMVETAAGLLSAIPAPGSGLDFFLRHDLAFWKRFSVPLIANISGASPAEFLEIAARLEPEVAAIELNLASLEFANDSEAVKTIQELIQKIKRQIHVPVIAKLSPFHSTLDQALVCEAGGADILALVHGFPGMTFDSRTRRPKLGSEWGNLSGPAIKPLALRALWQIRQVSPIPMIGMGGITSAADVLEFLAAGASAAAIGTATLINPRAIPEILNDLNQTAGGLAASWSAA